MPYVFESITTSPVRKAPVVFNPIRRFQMEYGPFLRRAGIEAHFAGNGFPTNLTPTGIWDAATVSAFTALFGEYVPERGGYAFGANLAQAWLNTARGTTPVETTRGAVMRFQARINFLLSLLGAARGGMASIGFVPLPTTGFLDAATSDALLRVLGFDAAYTSALMSSFANYVASR